MATTILRRAVAPVALLLAIAASGVPSDASAATPRAPAADRAQLQRKLDAVVRAGPPGAVLLVRHGDQFVVLTSGYDDRTAKTPIHASERFRVASLTKSYIAVVALQLVGEKKLELSDTVERWLPGAVPSGDGITVRQLLNHTSGLFDYFDDPRLMTPYERGKLAYRYTPRELLALGASHPFRFTPGTRYAYSNTGYIALGLIIEKATGHSLANELRNRIFTPLGLRATTFGLKPAGNARIAHGYGGSRGRTQDVSALNLSFEGAAGAVVSTADDVARFYRALLAGKLLRPDLLRAMEVPRFDSAPAYGLGLQIIRSPLGTVYGHSGDTPGYTTHAFSSRSGNRQIVVLYNLDFEKFPPIARRLDLVLMNAAYAATR